MLLQKPIYIIIKLLFGRCSCHSWTWLRGFVTYPELYPINHYFNWCFYHFKIIGKNNNLYFRVGLLISWTYAFELNNASI